MRLLSTGFAAYVSLLACERRSGRLLASSGGRAVNESGVGAAGARTAPDIHENQEALSVAKSSSPSWNFNVSAGPRLSSSKPTLSI